MTDSLEFEQTQFDPVVEDFLTFEADHFKPQTDETLEAGPGFDIHNPDTFPVRSIVTPRRRNHSELAPDERTNLLLRHWKKKDKFIIDVMNDKSAAGKTESVGSWTKRMGLKSTRALCKENPDIMDYELQSGEDGECGMCFSVNHGYTTDDLEDQAAHMRTVVPKDILNMSWPQQRAFRWNDPDGYAQWVEDLKEEMGPHFDESIVLPEYKFGERPQKAREVVEPDNITEIDWDSFVFR